LVYTVRSFSLVWGKTPFGMMRTRCGRRLVGSGVMRTTYGVAKGVAFCTLTLTLGLRRLWADTAGAIETWALVVSWIATALCIVRGAPVLVEAPTMLKDVDLLVEQQAAKR